MRVGYIERYFSPTLFPSKIVFKNNSHSKMTGANFFSHYCLDQLFLVIDGKMIIHQLEKSCDVEEENSKNDCRIMSLHIFQYQDKSFAVVIADNFSLVHLFRYSGGKKLELEKSKKFPKKIVSLQHVDEERIYGGTSTGDIYKWIIPENTIAFQFGMNSAIVQMLPPKNNSLFVAIRDEKIFGYSLEEKCLEKVLTGMKESVIYGDWYDDNHILGMSLNREIFLWNIANRHATPFPSITYRMRNEEPVKFVQFHHKTKQLFICLLNKVIRCSIDIEKKNVEEEIIHNESILKFGNVNDRMFFIEKDQSKPETLMIDCIRIAFLEFIRQHRDKNEKQIELDEEYLKFLEKRPYDMANDYYRRKKERVERFMNNNSSK
ncbi:hypothetical protein SNEBB_011491 [Seison nebaliae]|nr:hypothetical protein SNEBB_011491 [Seison nebaliae]